MDKKTLTKETHTKVYVEIKREQAFDLEFLVPNHLVDEKGFLVEEYEKKMTDFVECSYVDLTNDCNFIDERCLVVGGDYKVQKDDFDPDLPLVEDLLAKGC